MPLERFLMLMLVVIVAAGATVWAIFGATSGALVTATFVFLIIAAIARTVLK